MFKNINKKVLIALILIISLLGMQLTSLIVGTWAAAPSAGETWTLGWRTTSYDFADSDMVYKDPYHSVSTKVDSSMKSTGAPVARRGGEEIRVFCAQMGMALPGISTGLPMKGFRPEESAKFMTLSATARKGIAYTLLCGGPNIKMGSNAPAWYTANGPVTQDDLEAATQAIIWEYELGYRNLPEDNLENASTSGQLWTNVVRHYPGMIRAYRAILEYQRRLYAKPVFVDGTETALQFDNTTKKYIATIEDTNKSYADLVVTGANPANIVIKRGVDIAGNPIDPTTYTVVADQPLKYTKIYMNRTDIPARDASLGEMLVWIPVDGSGNEKWPIDFSLDKQLMVSGVPDISLQHNASFSMVIELPVIKSTKRANPANGAVIEGGEEITYYIDVWNVGAVDADNMLVDDFIPANTEFVRLGSDPLSQTGSYTPDDPYDGSKKAHVKWTLPTVKTGMENKITLSFVVRALPMAASACPRDIVNVAFVNGEATNDTTHSQCSSRLSYMKKSDPITGSIVKAGDIVKYTITVYNTGPDTIYGVNVLDPVPSGTTFVQSISPGGGSLNANNEVVWTNQTIPEGKVEFVYTAKVDDLPPGVPMRSFINQAYVNGMPTNPTEHYQYSGVITSVKTSNPPSGSIVDSTSTEIEKNQITYTITVKNHGADVRKDISVKDQIPDGTTYISSTPNASRSADLLTWNIASLDPGAEAKVSFTVSVNDLPTGVKFRTLENMAVVDGVNTNTTYHYQHSEQIAGVKRSNPMTGSSVREGGRITYYIDVLNTGSQEAYNISVKDMVPDGTKFISSAEPSGTTFARAGSPANELSWTIDKIEAGGSKTVSFTVEVEAMPQGTSYRIFKNVAFVNGINVNETEHYQYGSDIVASKTSDPVSGAIVAENSDITYGIKVKNAGPEVAHDIVVKDDIPAGTIFSASDSFNTAQPIHPTQSGETLTWNISSLASGSETTIFFRVKVKPLESGIDQRVIDNIAFVNNIPTNETRHYQYSDKVKGVKRSDPMTGTTMYEDDTITYYVDVINNGAEVAHNISVSDMIPDNTEFVDFADGNPNDSYDKNSHSPKTANGTDGKVKYLEWTVANVAPGETATVAFTVKVLKMPFGVPQREFRNVAYVNGINTNETEHYQYQPSITALKRAFPVENSIVSDNFGSNEITYYIDVYNNGADTIYDIPVSDQIPAGTEYIASSATSTTNITGGTLTGDTLNWTIKELAKDTKTTISFKVKVLIMPTNLESRDIDNVAIVNNKHTNHVLHKQNNFLMRGIKRALPVSGSDIHEGSEVTYYIDIYNNGPDLAKDIVVTDEIPDGMTYVAGSSTVVLPDITGGTLSQGRLTWLIKQIVPNEKITLSFKATAKTLAAGDLSKHIQNLAYINNTYPTNTVEHNVKKELVQYSKTAIPAHDSTVTEGQTIRYNIHVENNGELKATGDPTGKLQGVKVTDVIPAGVTLVSGTISHGGTYDAGTRTITWIFDTFSVNQKEDVTFEVTVDKLDAATKQSGFRVENFATVDGGKTNTVYHHVKKPVLEYSKDAKPTSNTVVMPGEIITYTVMVKNVGTLADKSVKVVDNIPDGTRYVAGSLTGAGAYKTLPNRIEWVIDTLNPGQEVYLTFQVEVRPLAYGVRELEIKNKASIYGYDTDGKDTNETIHNVYNDRLIPKKSAVPADHSSVRAGEQIEYTIKIYNLRGEDAYYVPVADTIPEGATYVPNSASDGGIYDPVSKRISWVIPYIGRHDSGSSQPENEYTHQVTFKVTGNALPEGVYAKQIFNVALIGEGGTKENPGTPTIQTNVVDHTIIEPIVQPSKTSIPAPNTHVYVGEEIRYTINLHNNTDITVVNVPVQDAIPAGTTYKNGSISTVSGGISVYDSIGKKVKWVIPSIAPKADVQVTFIVVVNELPYGKSTDTIRNVAYCGNGGGSLDNPGEPNISTQTVEHPIELPPVTGIKDSVPAGGTVVMAGQSITYKIAATNNATVNVKNVKISDSIPVGTTFSSAVAIPYQGVYDSGKNAVEWTIPEMTPGETVTVEFTVTANQLPAGITSRVINNTAVVSGTSTNNIQHTIEKPLVYGVKSSNPSSGSYVAANQKITYKITVYNDGSADKKDVVITDSIPVGTKYVDMSASVAHGGAYDAASGVVSWKIANLAKNSSVELTFDATVNALGAGEKLRTVENYALIDNIATNRVNHTIFYTPYFGVKSSVPALGEVVKTDDIITYKVRVENTDRDASPILNITDEIPLGTEYVAGSAKMTIGGVESPGSYDQYAKMVSWNVNSLASGAFVEVEFRVKVLAMDSGMTQRTIENTAKVNTTPTNTVWHRQESAPLSIRKYSNPEDKERVSVGQNVTYYIEVKNTNPFDVANIKIEDFIPGGTTYTGISSDSPLWDAANKKLVWNITSLAAGGTKVVSFEVKVDKLPETMQSRQIMNVAIVNDFPTNRVTNEVKKPQIVATKTANPVDMIPYSEVIEGQIIRYAITVKNIGEIADYNIRVKDIVPQGTQVMEDSISHSGVLTEREIDWTIPTLVNGQEMTLYFSVVVDKLAEGEPTRLIKNFATYGQGGELPQTPTNETVHKVNKSKVEPFKYATPETNATVSVGSTIKYTIKLNNTGTLTAANTIVTDTIPAGTMFVQNSIRGNGFYNAITNKIEWNVSNIQAGGTQYIGFDVIVLESALLNPSSEVVNSAFVDNFETNKTNHKVMTPGVFAQKSSNPPSGDDVAPGDEITYKITVTNNNKSAVVNVPVTDVVPVGVTYVPGSVSHDGIYAPANTRLRWVIREMQPSESVELTFKATVNDIDQEIKTFTIVNYAMYGQGGGTFIDAGIPDTATNEVYHIAKRPYISGEKTSSPASGSVVQAGTPIIYTITVRNFGPQTATGITVTDKVSEDLDFESASAGGWFDALTRTITWNNITAAELGGEYQVSFTARPKALSGGVTQKVINNTAYVNNSRTNTTTHTVTGDATPLPDLRISKATGAAHPHGSSVQKDDIISYSVVVKNYGAGSATNVIVTDAIPTGTTYVQGSARQNGVANGVFSGSTVTWNLGNMAYGAEATLTFDVTVNELLGVQYREINNIASVTAANSAQKDSNRITHIQYTTLPNYDITATKAATTDTPQKGNVVALNGRIYYTITVKNETANILSNVGVNDVIQPGATYIPGSGGTLDNGTVKWTIPTIVPYGTASVSFAVMANGTANDIYNSAYAVSGNKVAQTNQTHHTLEQSAVPVLNAIKSANPASGQNVLADSIITYSISVTNNTGTAAGNVEVYDVIPNGTVYQSISAGNNSRLVGNEVHWTIASLGAGETQTVSFAVKVIETAGAIYNVAYVNNKPTNTTIHYVNSVLDTVGLYKSSNPSGGTQVRPGEPVTYFIDVTKLGTSAANNVVVTDVIPAGTTYVPNSAKIDGALGGIFDGVRLTWALGTMAGGSVKQLSFQVTVNQSAPYGWISNQANVTSDKGDAVSNIVTHPIPTTPVPYIIATKNSVPSPGSAVSKDSQIVYTLQFRNTSTTTPLTNVTVTDDIPYGTTFISAENGGILSGSRVVWNVGSIAAGETLTLRFTVKVNDLGNVQTTIRNTAAVTTNSGSGVTNTVEHTYNPGTYYLTAQKSAAPAQGMVNVGDRIDYTIRVTNMSNAAAANVAVTDSLPAGTAYVAGSASNSGGTESGGVITWNIPSIAAGGYVDVSFSVTANGWSKVIENIAFVSHNNNTIITNKTHHEIPDTTTPPPVTVDKYADRAEGSMVSNNQEITYSISVVNQGTAPLTNVNISDAVPAYTTYVPGSASHGGAPDSSNTIRWVLSSLPVGTTVVSFRVKVGPLPVGQNVVVPISNTAKVNDQYTRTITHYGYSNLDPNPNPNPNPNITTSKSAYPASGSVVKYGDEITYYINASNIGGGTANNVTVTDVIPEGTQYVSGSATNGGQLNTAGTAVVWNAGSLAANGGVFNASFKVKVTAASGMSINNISNQASVYSPNTGNINTNTVVHNLESARVLTLEKTSNCATNVAVNDLITYTVKVKNQSSYPVTNVVVTDNIPYNTTYYGPASNNGVFNGSSVVWNIGTMYAGQELELTFVVRVNALNGATYASIINVATATSSVGNVTSNQIIHNVTSNPLTLQAVKTSNPSGGTVNVNDQITYSITVTNPSSIAATNVKVSDYIPTGTTYVQNSANPVATLYGNRLDWTIGTIQPGGSATVSFRVTVNSSNAQIENQATVTADGGYTTQTNKTYHNTGSGSVLVAKRSNIGNGDQVLANQEVTYYIDVQNTGSSVVNNVKVSDVIPAELTYVANSAVPYATQYGNTLTWNIGSINPGQTYTVSFRATVGAMPAGMTYRQISNRATVEYSGNTGTTTSYSNTVIFNQGGTGGGPGGTNVISVYKSADYQSLTVAPNTNLTYFLDVTNNGGSIAQNVQVYDTIPYGTTFVSAYNGGSLVGSEVRWTIASLNPGETRRLSFVVNTGSAQGGDISNTARAVYNSYTTYSNTIIHQRTTNNQNITVSKRSDKAYSTVNEGDIIRYYIDITNSGSLYMNNVKVYDNIPYGTTYQTGSANPYAVLNGNTLEWTITTLPPGQTATVSFEVRVSGSYNGMQIRNTARVTYADITQYSNEVVTNVNTGGGGSGQYSYVTATKRVSSSNITQGSTMTYYIDVTNNSQTAANNVVIRDTVPWYTTYVSSPGGTLTNNMVTWNIGTLQPGETRTVTMVVRVNNNISGSPSINNYATMEYTGGQTTTNTVTTVINNNGGNGGSGGNNTWYCTYCNQYHNNGYYCTAGNNGNNGNNGNGWYCSQCGQYHYYNNGGNNGCTGNNGCNGCSGNNGSNGNNCNSCNNGGNSTNGSNGGGNYINIYNNTGGSGSGSSNNNNNNNNSGGTPAIVNNNNNNNNTTPVVVSNNNNNNNTTGGSGSSNNNNNAGSSGSDTSGRSNNNAIGGSGGTVPNTGQDTPLVILILLAISALVAVYVFVVLPRKRSKKESK